mgnify:CR=1 FL=1
MRRRRDDARLSPWVRRFLTEHLVGERNLSGNTQRSYRDTLRLLLPYVSGHASRPVDELRVEAFGCKLKVSSLLGIDPKGGEKSKHKVPFDVTSPDFIRINGVPYLDAAETEGPS